MVQVEPMVRLKPMEPIMAKTEVVKYRDGLGQTYCVPLHKAAEFERRRGLLLWTAIAIQIAILVGVAQREIRN